MGGDVRILDAATGQLAGEDNYEIRAVLDTGTVGGATAFGQMDSLSSAGGPPASVPTTNAWIMVALILALVGVATLRLGRREAARS